MYDFVDKYKKWLLIAVLILIVPPFALFGIDSYFRNADTGGALAKFGDQRISTLEYSQALRQAQDRMREMMQGKADPAVLNSPEVKESVLNDLIEQRVTLAHAFDAGMTVSDAELQKIIVGIEAFRDETGKFSSERYRQLLSGQGMTPVMFENQIRTSIVLEQVRGAYAGSGFVPDTVVKRLLRIREQEREVSQVVFNPADYLRQVKISAEDVDKFYQENKNDFLIPERVTLEFLMLAQDALDRLVQVSDDEVKQYYQENIERFQSPEERSASHILIAVPAEAGAEEKKKARALADDILGQVKAAPARFGELARRHSSDPGSAERGGDLGAFARGMMVKEFDDAVFSLKTGELAGPVETQYGYHIIRLDEIKAVKTTPLAEVRTQIEEEIRKPKAGKAFAEAAETFNNTVYEQFDSLQPAADALKLTIQKSDWISRAGGNANPLFNNEKLLEAIFSEQVLKNKHNTEAIEVQPNTLVSARVVEYRPPETLPFDEVREDVRQHLTAQKAVEMAEAEGRAALEKLRKGESVKLAWTPPRSVTLQSRQGLHPEGAQAVFGADVGKLPAYSAVGAEQGRYVLYRISKVKDVTAVDPEQEKALGRQLSQMAGDEQFRAYVSSLRERADVKVDRKKLEAGS